MTQEQNNIKDKDNLKDKDSKLIKQMIANYNKAEYVFDTKGNTFDNLEEMCHHYNTYPEYFCKQIIAGKSKKEALLGKKPVVDILRNIAIVIATILCICLIFAIHQKVIVPLDDNFFDLQRQMAQQENDNTGEADATLGFEKLHIDYSNLVTVSGDTCSCSIENVSTADIRFSVELKLDTAQGNYQDFAKNDKILKQGEKIDSLSIIPGVMRPTSKVYGTLFLTLYEGESQTPLAHKVEVHSMVVSPA